MLAAQQLAKASYDQALADQAVAKLNLERSEVRASVNGTISNMDLRPGTYVTAGKGVMALVDSDTLHVEGYFEETKLPRIHVGAAVKIKLMGDGRQLDGRVESIAAGIEDRDRRRWRQPARQRDADVQLGPARAAGAGPGCPRRGFREGWAGRRPHRDGGSRGLAKRGRRLAPPLRSTKVRLLHPVNEPDPVHDPACHQPLSRPRTRRAAG